MIAFYGGTFDPVHRGHLHAASTVRSALGLDAVHLVLSARPPHRAPPVASADHRFAMLELACRAAPGLVPDTIELERVTPSFTYDTVTALAARAPDGVVHWVVGSDSFATLTQWHRWRELPQACNLIVLARPGAALPGNAELDALLAARRVATLDHARRGQILMLEAPMLDVSATRVRTLLAAGATAAELAELLDPAVTTYIRGHDLYRERTPRARGTE